jgi:hypothetical protein
MTITIAFDSNNIRKLRELAKFINELANIEEIERLGETNKKKIDEAVKLENDHGCATTVCTPLPHYDSSGVNEGIIMNKLPPTAIVVPASGLGGIRSTYSESDDIVIPLANEGIVVGRHEPTAEIGRGARAEIRLTTDDRTLDASGLPWDERLHSRTRSMTTDGLWRRQRGLSPAKANKLEAEIRSSITDAQKLAHEESKTRSVPPPPPPPVTDDSYVTLVKKITAAVETEKLSYERVKDILMQFGVSDLAALKNVAHLIPVIEQQLKEILNA